MLSWHLIMEIQYSYSGRWFGLRDFIVAIIDGYKRST